MASSGTVYYLARDTETREILLGRVTKASEFIEQALHIKDKTFSIVSSFDLETMCFYILMDYERVMVLTVQGQVLKKWRTTDFHYATNIKAKNNFFVFTLSEQKAIKLIEVVTDEITKRKMLRSFYLKLPVDILSFELDTVGRVLYLV